MNLPTQKQVSTIVRYLTAIVGSGFVASVLTSKGYSVAQVTALIQTLGDTFNNVVTLVAAMAALYAAGKGVAAASPTNQIAAVKQDAANGSQDAKAALLDATASLPEVVGDIKVADAALVNSTTSSQVVPVEGTRS